MIILVQTSFIKRQISDKSNGAFRGCGVWRGKIFFSMSWSKTFNYWLRLNVQKHKHKYMNYWLGVWFLSFRNLKIQILVCRKNEKTATCLVMSCPCDVS